MAKDFAWKDSQEVGEVFISEKKKVAVEFNSLDYEKDGETEERWYVSLATKQFFLKKPETEKKWHITKNATFPLETWDKIVEMVNDNLE